jgi:hypothetical protein
VGRIDLMLQLRFKANNNPFVVSLSNHLKPVNGLCQCGELRINPLIIWSPDKTC